MKTITKKMSATVMLFALFVANVAAQKSVSIATVTNQPVTATIATQPQSQNKCLGSSVSFTVAASGTAPISYQWKKNGSDIANATNATLTISNLTLADEGIYTCEVGNLCRSTTSNGAELKVIQVTTDAGADTRICPTNNTQLQATSTTNHAAESGNISYAWAPSGTLSAPNISNPTASPTNTTVYTVTATDQLGCKATDNVQVTVGNPNQTQRLCLVTVDQTTWKNKIMWEKQPGDGTAYYVIYKETGLNSYSQIGNVAANQPGEFIDNFSNPESHSDKYKLTVIDTCGNESAQSPYHKTMNLVIAANGSTMGLSWDKYVDESGNFAPFRFYIFRGTQPDNMVLHDSLSGSFTTYNDNNVFDVYYYMIGVKRANACNTAKSFEEFSFSNQKDNSTLVGINTASYSKNISIAPNPFTESTTLTFSNPSNAPYLLTITDITGKVVREETITGNTYLLNRGTMQSGMYFVEISGEKVFRGKVVVE